MANLWVGLLTQADDGSVREIYARGYERKPLQGAGLVEWSLKDKGWPPPVGYVVYDANERPIHRDECFAPWTLQPEQHWLFVGVEVDAQGHRVSSFRSASMSWPFSTHFLNTLFGVSSDDTQVDRPPHA